MLANLNDVLLPAAKNKYAVGLFNAVNMEMARGIIAAAEELRSPVIVGTAQILLPYGPLNMVADMLIPLAKAASVPVVVHFDHGLDKEMCEKALDLGFTSIMYDCSSDSYESNISKVREITDRAHRLGATVEAELGHVGNASESDAAGNQEHGSSLVQDFYTCPEQARDYVCRTGADALAVAVGTAHGTYKAKPCLDFERIEKIRELTRIPLVLHGGSGLSDEDFRRAIECGISKINIFTDINIAAASAAAEALQSGKSAMTDLIPVEIEAVKQEVMKKMKLFGSCGKA